jgi:formylglycine-generating enzyme
MATTTATPPGAIIKSIPYFNMVPIKKGHFQMGGKEKDELPVHPVSMATFYMGQYPVTQALWHCIMDENPSYFKGNRRPVEQVSWDDIRGEDGFLNRLNRHPQVVAWLEKEGLKGWQFRLPAEAEWEYAARGGKNHEFAGSDMIDEVAWYGENSHGETKPVGMKAPNGFDLYDMSGNVWEWCEDDWHPNYEKAPKDGKPWIDRPERGGGRVIRGGGYIYDAGDCRVAFRSRFYPGARSDGIGFRLALSPQVSSGQGGA